MARTKSEGPSDALRMGFVILSHQPGNDLGPLVDALRSVYPDPPIVVHHDASRGRLRVPTGVELVEPHVRTHWGGLGLVRATVAGIEQLYRSASPDWFTLLSTVDYPLASGESVLAEIAASGYDAYLESARVAPGEPGWHGEVIERYFGNRFWLGSHSRLIALARRPHWNLGFAGGPFARFGNIFDDEYRCYGGSQWFSGNRRVAKVLIDSPSTHRALWRRYRHVAVPDESLIHTVLGNTPGLRLGPSRRFYEFAPQGGPVEITPARAQELLRGDFWFGRKVSPGNEETRAFLDRALGVRARAASERSSG